MQVRTRVLQAATIGRVMLHQLVVAALVASAVSAPTGSWTDSLGHARETTAQVRAKNDAVYPLNSREENHFARARRDMLAKRQPTAGRPFLSAEVVKRAAKVAANREPEPPVPTTPAPMPFKYCTRKQCTKLGFCVGRGSNKLIYRYGSNTSCLWGLTSQDCTTDVDCEKYSEVGLNARGTGLSSAKVGVFDPRCWW